MREVGGSGITPAWKRGETPKEASKGSIEIGGKEREISVQQGQTPASIVASHTLPISRPAHSPPVKSLPLTPFEAKKWGELEINTLERISLSELEQIGDRLALAYRTEVSKPEKNEDTLEIIKHNLDLVRDRREGRLKELSEFRTDFQKACDLVRTLAYDYEGRTKLGRPAGEKEGIVIQKRSWVSGLIGFGGLSGRSKEAEQVVLELLERFEKASPEELSQALEVLKLLGKTQWFEAVIQRHPDVKEKYENLKGLLQEKTVKLEMFNFFKKIGAQTDIRSLNELREEIEKYPEDYSEQKADLLQSVNAKEQKLLTEEINKLARQVKDAPDVKTLEEVKKRFTDLQKEIKGPQEGFQNEIQKRMDVLTAKEKRLLPEELKKLAREVREAPDMQTLEEVKKRFTDLQKIKEVQGEFRFDLEGVQNEIQKRGDVLKPKEKAPGKMLGKSAEKTWQPSKGPRAPGVPERKATVPLPPEIPGVVTELTLDEYKTRVSGAPFLSLLHLEGKLAEVKDPNLKTEMMAAWREEALKRPELKKWVEQFPEKTQTLATVVLQVIGGNLIINENKPVVFFPEFYNSQRLDASLVQDMRPDEVQQLAKDVETEYTKTLAAGSKEQQEILKFNLDLVRTVMEYKELFEKKPGEITSEDLERLGDKAIERYQELKEGTDPICKLLQSNLDFIHHILPDYRKAETPFQKASALVRDLVYDYKEETKLGRPKGKEEGIEVKDKSWLPGTAGASAGAEKVTKELLQALQGAETPKESEQAKKTLSLLGENKWFQAVKTQHYSVQVEFEKAQRKYLSPEDLAGFEVKKLKEMISLGEKIKKKDLSQYSEQCLAQARFIARLATLEKTNQPMVDELRQSLKMLKEAPWFKMGSQVDELEKNLTLLDSAPKRLESAKQLNAVVALHHDVETLPDEFKERRDGLLKQISLLEKNLILLDSALERSESAQQINTVAALRREVEALPDAFKDQREALLKPIKERLRLLVNAGLTILRERERAAKTLSDLNKVQGDFNVFREEVKGLGGNLNDLLNLGERATEEKARNMLIPLLEEIATNLSASKDAPSLEKLHNRCSEFLRQVYRFPGLQANIKEVQEEIENRLNPLYKAEQDTTSGVLLSGQKDLITNHFKNISDHSLGLAWNEIKKVSDPEQRKIWMDAWVEAINARPDAFTYLLQQLPNSGRKELYKSLNEGKLLSGEMEKAFKAENIRRSLLIAIDEEFCKAEIDKESDPTEKESIREAAKYVLIALNGYVNGDLNSIVDVLGSIIQDSQPKDFEKIQTFIKKWVDVHEGDTNFDNVKERLLTLGDLPPSERVAEPPSLAPPKGGVQELLDKVLTMNDVEREQAAKDIASDLTAVTASLFMKWNPTYEATSRKIEEGKFEIIEFVNSLSSRITEDILFKGGEDGKGNPHLALQTARFWMKVAAQCRDQGNLHAAMLIFGALNHAAVSRVIKEDPNLERQISELGLFKDASGNERNMFSPDGSYKGQRAYIEEREQEAIIPYLGMANSDSTFVKEGNPETGALSPKISLIGKVIQKLQGHQERIAQRGIRPPKRDIQSWVKEGKEELQKKADQETNKTGAGALDQYLFTRSLAVRPRKRDSTIK